MVGSTLETTGGQAGILGGLMVLVSLGVYGGLILAAVANPEVGASIVAYGLMFSLIGLFAHGLALGRVRGNAVRVSERQFPQLHRLVAAHSRRLGLKQPPSMYVMESGGLLNAFATRFLGRDFVIIHSDVLELALAQGESAVGFIVGHELAHVWRAIDADPDVQSLHDALPFLGGPYPPATPWVLT